MAEPNRGTDIPVCAQSAETPASHTGKNACATPGPCPSALSRWLPNAEWVLLLVLLVECVGFGLAHPRFLTLDNGFEIARLAAEVGLLAFGLTFVIKTGGIDLSVGSLMGLVAVTLGGTWSLGLPVWLAAALALALGAAAGALHGVLISRLRVPPLIVTLGTFSLFRGLAEAITGGATSYTGFPRILSRPRPELPRRLAARATRRSRRAFPRPVGVAPSHRLRPRARRHRLQRGPAHASRACASLP